ncbi:MAG: hypothetical protein ABWY45_01605 [Mycobacterium sp.]
MGVTPGVDTTPAARVRRWFADLGFKQMWQLAVVVVLAVTALFGGLDNVNTKVTVFEPGEDFSDGQYTLVVDRASLVEEIKAGTRVVLPENPGHHYLGLVVRLTNDGTVPGNLLREFDLVGHRDQRFIGAYRMADSTYNVNLGPGLTEELAFFWELPEGDVGAGESVTLRVWKKKFVELFVTYGKTWVDSETDYGEITVPVRGRS